MQRFLNPGEHGQWRKGCDEIRPVHLVYFFTSSNLVPKIGCYGEALRHNGYTMNVIIPRRVVHVIGGCVA